MEVLSLSQFLTVLPQSTRVENSPGNKLVILGWCMGDQVIKQSERLKRLSECGGNNSRLQIQNRRATKLGATDAIS